MKSEAILVLNAGSSSLKYRTYVCPDGETWREDAKGQIEERELAGWLGKLAGEHRILGAGHRVVHGGTEFSGPVVIDAGNLARLRDLIPLAPLHQPHNLAGIAAVEASLPGTPQVACFDTSFHHGRGELAEMIALPRKLCRENGLLRYGFHGISYEYIASVLPIQGRVIVAHLGNGASLCAMVGGKAVDCTMSFSTLDGLCMGTRPGAIDAGAVLYLFQHLGMTVEEVEDLLYRQSGLLGISGVGNDMRELMASDLPAAKLAIDYFVRQIAKEIGGLSALMGGLDGIVFTAGIGEHSPEIRARVGKACEWLGLEIDEAANTGSAHRISTEGSRVGAWMIPTNEEWMIALHTANLLGFNLA